MKTLFFMILMFSITAMAGQHFKTDSDVPMPELIKELETVYNDQIKNKDVISITVEGHTDQRASDAYNQELSERRAKSAKAELIRMGAPKDKITSIGKGESELVTNGTTLEDYARNRRVVVIVKSKDGTATTVISEEKKCETKVVEKTKIKKHLVSLVMHKRVIKNETDTSSSGGTTVGTGTVEENYSPAITYQYQFDSGVVPMIGLDVRKNPNLLFGVGYEF